MKIALIIVASVIVVINISLHITFKLNYDILQNIGRIRIKFFGITLFSSEISLIGEYFNLIRRNNKVIQIKLDLNDTNIQFIKDIGYYFKKSIYLIGYDGHIHFAIDNPALCSTICGNIIVLTGILDTYMLSNNPNAHICTSVTNNLFNNNIQVWLKVSVLISIIDFLRSVCMAIHKRRVRDYERKRQC